MIQVLRRISFLFLSQVSDFELSNSMSLIFAMAPDIESYIYYLML